MGQEVRFGVVGVHGYSRSHIDAITGLARAGGGVSLAACAVYEPERDPAYVEALRATGVRLTASVDELLALGRDRLDVITVPTGIGLHVPIATKALEAGFPVIVEKPVAGTVQEVDALIAARDRAGLPLLVGYQWMYHCNVLSLKRALLAGMIGAVREVRALVSWPRGLSYYARNGWAGKLRHGESWVLDSPINNACAHYLLLALYFAEDRAPMAADPVEIRAELYRANAIESLDTAALDIRTAQGSRVLFLVSHAAEEQFGPVIRVIGERGIAVFSGETATIEHDGMVTRFDETNLFGGPFHAMAALLRGDASVPHCSLELARPQTVAVNGAHLSSPVRAIPEACITLSERKHRCVPGLFAALSQAYEEGITLHETGRHPWTVPGAWTDVRGLTTFPAPLAAEEAATLP